MSDGGEPTRRGPSYPEFAMNPRYKETFARHRVLFTMPVVVAVLFALWSVVGSGTKFEASTSLWVDTPAPGVSSLENTNTSLLTPSAQAQQLLGELLTTRSFRLAVGHEGPLASYVAKHPAPGWGPGAFLAKVRGSGSVDDRISAALGPKNVLTTIAGPQVLGVSVRSTSSPVAVGTLKALVDQFNLERKNLDVGRQQASMSFYKNQVLAAQATLSAAQTNLQNGSAPGSTASLHDLTQAEHVAEARLRTATRAYNQAALNVAASKSEKGIFRVIDPIEPPAKAVGGKKKTLFALVAGLFVGALMSFLGIVFVSGRENRAGRDALGAPEVDAELLGEPLVASANGASHAAPRIPVVEERGG
jgi:uncharacterized protein involved in exopolysaccharide biosynthesis